MPRVDWLARLDAHGRHITDVDKPKLSVQWCGETRTAEDSWTEGDAVIVTDASVRSTAKPQELTIMLGDFVYCTAKKKDFAEIIQVIDIFSNPETNDIWLGMRHLWRPSFFEDAALMQLPEFPHARELFFQPERDVEEIDIQNLEMIPVKVLAATDFDFEGDVMPHTFFWRREYDGKFFVDPKPPTPPGATAAPPGATGSPPSTAPAPADDTPPAQEDPARPKRRNVQAERLAALEAKVVSLQLVVDAQATQLVDVRAEFRVDAVKLQQMLDALTARVTALE